MATLHCRKCNADIIAEAMDCPKCKAHLPLTCARCRETIGGVQVIGSTYPFTKEGLPLCPRHALTLCDKCHRPFDRSELTLRVVRWEQVSADMRVPVNGGFCPVCNAGYVEPPMVEKKTGCLGILLLLTGHR